MKHKIYCEVCQVSFIHKGELAAGAAVICTVCGAKLEVIELEPEVKGAGAALHCVRIEETENNSAEYYG